jgi:hypothetical protein
MLVTVPMWKSIKLSFVLGVTTVITHQRGPQTLSFAAAFDVCLNPLCLKRLHDGTVSCM